MSKERPVLGKIGLLQNSNVPLVDAYLREYPVPYSTTMEIVTANSSSKLTLPDIDFFSDKYVLGMFIRKQVAGGTRYSKNNKLLINDTELDNAFLTIMQAGAIVVEDHPLGHFVQDSSISGLPGSYTQLIIDGGFSTNNSYIRFSNAAPANGKAIELTWIWVYRHGYCHM